MLRSLTHRPERIPPRRPDHEYAYRHAEESTSTLRLENGSKIGYAQYGDREGKPIILLPGPFGSKLAGVVVDENAKKLGANIICIERPGFGDSSPYRKSRESIRLTDHAADVKAVAKHLELEDYAILASTDGGPFALACAYVSSSLGSRPRLRAVSLVHGTSLGDMPRPQKLGIWAWKAAFDMVWAFRFFRTRPHPHNLDLAEAELRKNINLNMAKPQDAEVFRDPDALRLFVLCAEQSLVQGGRGVGDEKTLLQRKPGFRVEDIRPDLPFQLWYGLEDKGTKPQEVGPEIARRLRAGGNKNVELHMESGETAISMTSKFQEEILKSLLNAMDS